MNDNEIEALKDRPLTRDDDLVRLVASLLDTATVARVWLLLLDARMRSTGVLIPLDDRAADPSDVAAMPSSGAITAAELTGQVIARVVRQTPASYAVVAWERPGPARLTLADRSWIRQMTRAFADDPEALRAQLVVSDEGVALVVDSEGSVRAA
ncbi:hypothetical protein [Microbacterium excoecariae]|uniref:hypothetical protein n=1 Tax=Microbacterium excoecariae TaxID=2715210 RepID=UPI00140B2BA0|nr:hypothetical protein [Microbacterium excoecariae]NHI16726.1 hypothetical protein [Microbacterium excoecariae]